MPQHDDSCDMHPTCELRLKAMEQRLGLLEGDVLDQNDKWAEIGNQITSLKEAVANLNGRLAGYLVAATLLGTIVAFLAQFALHTK